MCSGFDRYFQLARCYRDEDLRADRQPEFTQIDMELSFVDVEDVLDVNERLLKKIFKEICDFDVQLPIQRMTWREAMDRFGSDKPDLRFGMELKNVSDVVRDCERRSTPWWNMPRALGPRDWPTWPSMRTAPISAPLESS